MTQVVQQKAEKESAACHGLVNRTTTALVRQG